MLKLNRSPNLTTGDAKRNVTCTINFVVLLCFLNRTKVALQMYVENKVLY